MIEAAFFDTNVLVYLYDARAPDKQRMARELVGRYFSERKAAVSTQVLQEFFVTVTQKAARLPLRQAKALVGDYMQLNVITIAPVHILDAIDLQEHFGISFWDALIVAAAKAAGARILFSEDLSHGQAYEGVRVQNPFLAAIQ